jgi:hypothetical protein
VLTDTYDSGFPVGYSYWHLYANNRWFLPLQLNGGPANPNGGLAIYYSTDAVTWIMGTVTGLPTGTSLYFPYQNTSFGQPSTSCFAYRNGVYVIVVQNIGFLRSTDGVNWVFIAYSLGSSQYDMKATPWGFACNDGNGIHCSVDNGLTWRHVVGGSSYSDWVCLLKNANKTVMMTDYDGTQYETVDGVGWVQTKAQFNYPQYLFGSVSSDKVDLMWYGYGSYDSSAKLISCYASVYRPEWSASPFAMAINLPQPSYGYAYPPSIVWPGSKAQPLPNSSPNIGGPSRQSTQNTPNTFLENLSRGVLPKPSGPSSARILPNRPGDSGGEMRKLPRRPGDKPGTTYLL